MSNTLKDLGYRIVTALVILLLTVPIIFYGGFLNTVLLFVVYGIAVFEYLSSSLTLSRAQLFGVTALYFILPLSIKFIGVETFFGTLLCILIGSASILIFSIEQFSNHPDVKKMYFGVVSSMLYPVLPLLALFVICEHYSGEYLLWVMVCVITADTLAYFVGKAVGGKALSPRISPNKSWSGSIAGIIGASLASLAWGTSFEFGEPVLRLIALGLLIGILAVIGDLFESLMKRALGTKDMGNLLPGHGGVLDRIDALLFAAPVIFLM